MNPLFKFLAIICLSFISLARPFSAAAQSGEKDSYNVLFIAIDDLNDYVHLLKDFPGVKTPNLDKFSKTALNFTHAYCAAPACNPSRTSILTGKSPINTGVYGNMDDFNKSEAALNATLLPEIFKANGYRTMWSGKIFHTRPNPERMKAMWDDMEGHDGGYGPIPTVDNISHEITRPGWFNYQQWEGPDSDFPDVVNAGLTIKRLQKSYDKPFFMALGLYRPHNPWTAPKRFFDLYPLDSLKMPDVPEDDLDDLSSTAKRWAHHPVHLDSLKKIHQWKPVLRSYLASISFTDYNLGRVLDTLDRSPYRDNTIVVLWADNGFHMGEKKHFAKYGLWEKTTHELFMVRAPGISPGGEVVKPPVSLLDIYPTLVDLCNLSKPDQSLDGVSLAPLIKDPEMHWDRPALTYYKYGSTAVRTSRWRYIRYYDGSEELYDEHKDPREWHNLARGSAYKQTIRKLQKWLPDMIAPRAGGRLDEKGWDAGYW